jgi:hypothetical protein
MRKAYKVRDALHLAGTTHLVTFKTLPGDPVAVHKLLGKMIRSVRKRGGSMEWAWVIENHSHTSSLHAHAHVRCVSERDLTLLAEVGSTLGTTVHIEEYTSTVKGARYLLKGILDMDLIHEPNDYDKVSITAGKAISDHFHRNGNRIVHASQGYWRTPDGHRTTLTELVRRREADPDDLIVYPKSMRAAMIRRLRGGDTGP